MKRVRKIVKHVKGSDLRNIISVALHANVTVGRSLMIHHENVEELDPAYPHILYEESPGYSVLKATSLFPKSSREEFTTAQLLEYLTKIALDSL